MHFMAKNPAAPVCLSVSLPQSTAGSPLSTPVQMPRRSSDPLARSSYMVSEMMDPSPSAIIRNSIIAYEMPTVKGQRLMVLTKALMRQHESTVDADSPYLTDLLPGDVCYFLEAGRHGKNRIKVQTHDREGWVSWKTLKIQILSIHPKEV